MPLCVPTGQRSWTDTIKPSSSARRQRHERRVVPGDTLPGQARTGLPTTRSGKIMRRILRKMAAGEYDGLGDVTTLAEPEVVEKLIEQHTQRVTGNG